MGRKFKFIALLLCTMTLFFALPLESFADNVFDKNYDDVWKTLDYVVGQEYAETGATCPKCGASLRKIDQGTCPSCGYNALIVDEDGKITYKTGGGKAGTGGVGRPKGYKEDNTPTVTSSGLYTMYVHPTFVRRSTGLPFANGTEQSIDSSTGNVQEGRFFTVALETNRVTVSFSAPDSGGFSINSNVYYYITAPVTGHYEFKDWDYTTVKCAGTLGSIDKTLSIKLGAVNLSKGNTERGLYFNVKSDLITNGQFTYLYVPDLVVKYTPYNSASGSYQPLEKRTSITANGKEVTGTIYHDPENNYYYAYDDNDNCTIYVENKKGDIIGDVTYDQTENIYITNIYPGATTGEDDDSDTPSEDVSGIMKILQEIKAVLVNGFAGITGKLDNISTPETAKPGSSSGDKGQSWWEKLLGKIGDAIVDGLLGAISAVLKLIFKLFTTILGWIIWLVSQVLTLFPFLPPGLGALLIGGVVVCFIIGLIKFIRG